MYCMSGGCLNSGIAVYASIVNIESHGDNAFLGGVCNMYIYIYIGGYM